jgi:hypothetical protein
VFSSFFHRGTSNIILRIPRNAWLWTYLQARGSWWRGVFLSPPVRRLCNNKYVRNTDKTQLNITLHINWPKENKAAICTAWTLLQYRQLPDKKFARYFIGFYDFFTLFQYFYLLYSAISDGTLFRKEGRDQRMANTAHTTVSTYTRINNAWNETTSWYLSSSYCSPLSLLGFVIGTDWSACWILQNYGGFLSIVAYPTFSGHFKFTGPTQISVTDKSKHLMPAAIHQ